MAKYEHINIKGIPFLVDEARVVYTYESLRIGETPPIPIGTYDIVTQQLTFYPDWQERTAERISAWRASLAPTERGKIRELYKPPKQSRSRKSTGKSKSTAS